MNESRARPSSAPGATGDHDGECRPLRILLAEDAPQNRMLILLYFKNTPHQIDVAENGQVAVDKFMAGSYDLVLMDVHMPVMDGYAATREIRSAEAARRTAPTPIIALTAHALAEDIEDSRRAGCDDHVTKPLNFAVLLEIVDRYARASPKRQPNEDRRDDGSGPSPADRLIVRAPRDVAALIPEYLAITRADLDVGLASLAQGDPGPLGTLGHNLRGSGAGYGLGAIGEIGRQLERNAATGSASLTGEHAATLRAYLDRLEIVYE